MNTRGAVSPSTLGAFLVGLFLVLLFILEPVLTPTKFQFSFSSKPQLVDAFALDQKLKILTPGPLKGTHRNQLLTLQELFDRELQGTDTLIVNFWATWCDPCLEEIPSLDYLSRQLAASKNPSFPRLITISVDEKGDAVDKLFSSMEGHPALTVLHDPEGLFSRTLGTVRFPETYWINRQGKVLHKWIGPQNWLSPEIIEKIGVLSKS